MDNKTFSVLDKLIKIFSQKGNITPDEIQELKDYLIETNIVDSDEDADSWIRNYLNKKYPEVKILKLEETLNPQNMTNEQLRMQFLSGVITESEYKTKLEKLNSTEKKDSLNEHYIAGGIVGVGAINNPFEGRKKESYEDAFEYFLSSKYNLNEAEAEVNEDEDELEEGKEVEEPSLYEGEEPLKDISDEEKAEYLVYMTGMDYNEALMKVRQS